MEITPVGAKMDYRAELLVVTKLVDQEPSPDAQEDEGTASALYLLLEVTRESTI